jgi:hypothetical protein
MMKAKKILGAAMLVMLGVAALLLHHMKANQRLGEPGVKTRPLAGEPVGSLKREVLMPESAPGYTSTIVTNSEAVLGVLPKDTSFRVRAYAAEDNFWVSMTAVLMGSDRTSIHRPDICLPGQGWAIDVTHSGQVMIPMTQPVAYDLPVNRIFASKQFADESGKSQTYRSIFIYWFVDGNHLTASANEWKLWWMPRDLLLHGTLQRWAYISAFAICAPGQEEATFERMKKLIASTVPEFQLVPKAGG